MIRVRGDRLPICIFADDGHFSDPDPDTVDLLQRLLVVARADRWPLLLIVTHWEDRWNEDTSAVARWLKPQSQRLAIMRFSTLRANELSPVLEQHFPGLLPHQAAKILGRADGNPQFLDEIIVELRLREGDFLDADPGKALTDEGLASVLSLTVNRHHLNTVRFRQMSKEGRGALAVGSLQGQRMLQDLTAEVCAAVGFANGEQVRTDDALAGLAKAEMPHNFVKREGRWAEFLQLLYREIAAQDMRHIPMTRGHVEAALITSLRRRLLDSGEMQRLGYDDALSTLALGWFVLRAAPDEVDASIGASAAATLIAERLSRHDYLGAGQRAQELVDTMRARMGR